MEKTLKVFLRKIKNKIKSIYQTNKKDEPKHQFEYLYQKFSFYSMVSRSFFLDNLDIVNKYVSSIRFTELPIVVECGVWRGGMLAAMAEMLGNQYTYYLFDSFEGLPEVKEIDGIKAKQWQNDKQSKNYYNNCTAEIEFAQNAMLLSNVNNYHIIKGWFENTLPQFNQKANIHILRLDADWYDSTMACLVHLFPKVCENGIIIIDDYYTWDGCSRAVHDYLSIHKRTERIQQFNNKVCFIIKQNQT